MPEYKFDFKLDDFQEEALFHINNGKSVVVCAPTGAGKTCIAQMAIHKALNEGHRIFYTTPLKALSNQKYSDFSEKYGTDKVGLLTGDTSINRSAQIVVMTTEVFRNMLYGTNFGSVSDNLKDVRYVVLDEVHYMNDEQRGTVWEESIIYCPTNVQIIALSATVANSQQLTDWINTVHSRTELVYTDFRPVPLRYYYYDSSKPNDILTLLTPDGKLNKKIKPESKAKYFGRRSKMPQRQVAKDVVSILHKKNMLPAIYFTFSRKKCDEQMEKCAGLCLTTPDEQKEIKRIVDDYIAENPYLYNNKHLEYILCGVASHHAGLLPGWKVLVEKLFQKGLIKVVFATETLAAGINMPARSTVISAVSKRTDSGHRMLTPSEFLQMSGRAGRRGMDEIGYVTIIGTAFQSPEEVAQLVTSEANPLESRFSPTYSMVINLLQRFTLDEAKELILKSFGYYSSTTRLTPLMKQMQEINDEIENFKSFKCPFNRTAKDMFEYNKLRNTYVEQRKTVKIMRKQVNKKKPESVEYFKDFEFKTKQLLHTVQSYQCDTCKLYRKHMKQTELLDRFEKRADKLEKTIEYEKDIYWRKFLNHTYALEKAGYLENRYPNEKGLTIGAIRAENELFLAEIILSGILDTLKIDELASVICAITTEDLRADVYPEIPISKGTRKALNKIKDIRRRLTVLQRDFDIDTEMYINSYYSPLIEYWVNGGEWEELVEQVPSGEGDVVRCFKRTIDVLRQLTVIPNVSDELVQNARAAIDAINRSPVDID